MQNEGDGHMKERFLRVSRRVFVLVAAVMLGVLVLFSAKAYAKTGWDQQGSDWYYYDANGNMVTSNWIKYKNTYYYFNANGKLAVSQFVTYGGNTYYVNASGVPVYNYWLQQGSDWYYFKSNGAMISYNWLNYKNSWYFFGYDGRMWHDGFVLWNGKNYYMGSNGAMVVKNWAKVEGNYFYFDANGEMLTLDWLNYNGAWYYFDSDGKLVTSDWAFYNDEWYYLFKDGKMIVNDWVEVDGYWYFCNSYGARLTNSWYQYKGDWYFLDYNGRMVQNTGMLINNTYYTFNADGILTEERTPGFTGYGSQLSQTIKGSIVGTCNYFIPTRINPGTSSVLNSFNNTMNSYANEANAAIDSINKTGDADLVRFTYHAYFNGNMVSFVTYDLHSSDMNDHYMVFNIDDSQSSYMTASQVVAKAGMNMSTFKYELRIKLSDVFIKMFGNLGMAGNPDYLTNLEKTTSDANLNAAQPFIDGNGKLCVVTGYYGFVGANYTQIILPIQ